MLQEIAEQPGALEATLTAEKSKYETLGRVLRDKDIRMIVLVARGSSDNASLFGRYLLEISCGIPVSLCAPSVFTLYDAKVNYQDALVIGVSQSGEGTDINTVLERAKASGAMTLGITNESDSSMSKIVDESLLIHAGREKSVAATKTYTGQMLHFYMLANALGANHVAEKIPDYVAKALELKPHVAEFAKSHADMTDCVVVGRGLNYGNSYELALKLMETCYVVAERFSSADFFHGPLAIVERGFPAIFFGPQGVTKKSNMDLLERLKELGADSLSITNDDDIARLSSHSIMMPKEIDEFLSPIPFIIPGQLFAALLAQEKGINADAPRSLSKVTKTV